MGNWETKLIRHKGEQRITIYFDNDRKKNDFVKSIAGSKWSRTLHAWHVPDTDENRVHFEIVSMNGPVMSEEIRGAIADFKDWLRSRRYSENTVGTYSEALKSFFFSWQDHYSH
jgi:integrase/recombinase XerD